MTDFKNGTFDFRKLNNSFRVMVPYTQDIFVNFNSYEFFELVCYLTINSSDIYLISDGECVVHGAPYIGGIIDRPGFYHTGIQSDIAVYICNFRLINSGTLQFRIHVRPLCGKISSSNLPTCPKFKPLQCEYYCYSSPVVSHCYSYFRELFLQSKSNVFFF